MATELLGEDFIQKDPADVAMFLKEEGISDEICEKFEGKAQFSHKF